MRKAGLGLFLLCASVISAADDDRTHLPSIFHHSYLGLELGYMRVNYTNAYLKSGYTAESFNGNGFSYHFSLGHYVNPYLAFELNGFWMYPKTAINHLNGFTNSNRVKYAVLGAFVKPTLPITDRLSAFGLLGLGFVTRGYVYFQNVDVVGGSVVGNGMLGAGMNWELSKAWGLDFSGTYGFSRRSVRLPSFFNIGAGAHFKFSSLD